jgi:PelA/Pel-15E family pectate lyase
MKRFIPALPLLAAALSLLTSPASAAEPVRWHVNLLKQSQEWFASAEARAVADSVLLYQSPQGGWPKSTDIAKPPLTPDDIPPVGRGRANSLDNEATTLPMQFLARMVDATGEAKYRDAFTRGLDYLFAAQYPNGGWPQFFPLRGEYYDRITFNDNAMVRVMTLLSEVRAGQPPYGFVTKQQRTQSDAAVSKAVECVLRTQIKQDGKLTAWCAQYDKHTLAPAWARSYEPPSLSGSESVGITRFLMSIEQPSPEVMAAIEAAVAWMKSTVLQGVRLESFTNAEGKPDKRLIPDADAPALWARFYEIGTNKPIFTSRQSVIHYAISEIEHEKRNAYDFYGNWPAKLIDREYPEWRARHPQSAEKPSK